MPIFTNPEVQKLMHQQGFDPSTALRSIGLVAPTADVMRMPGDGTSNVTYRLGEGIGAMAENKKLMAPIGKAVDTVANSAPGTAAMGAIVGGLGGAAFGAGTDRNPLLFGLLGAGLGGAGGYGISKLIQMMTEKRRQRDLELSKRAFYVENGQDPMAYIQTKLFSDGATGSNEKAQMLAQLREIPERELFALVDILRMAGGAGAGYIIGKFLMRFGGFGTAVSTGLGAMLGSALGNRPKRNMLGLEVDPSRDFFGNPRLVY